MLVGYHPPPLPAHMPPDPARRQRTLAAAAIVVAALAVYANTLGHGFVLDDGPEVVDNAFIRSLSDLPRALTSPSWEGAGETNPPQYRPLTTATFSLNYAFFGLEPMSYHLVNVLLHAGTSVLVLALALQLGMPLSAALLAGLLFATLPVHVEAVANIAGRKDLLVALLCLATVLLHTVAMRRGGAATFLAPLALAAALFSKEVGISCLGLVAARDLVFGRKEWRLAWTRGLALFAAYAVLAGLYLWARWSAVGSLVFPGIGFEENPLAYASTRVRILTAIAVLGRGVSLLLFPRSLSPDYSYRAIPAVGSVLDPWFLLSLAGGLAVLTVAVRGRRRSPVTLFAALWYALSIFPASNLVVPIGTIFGERLLYLPSVGFCLALGGLLGTLAATRAAAVAYAASTGILVAFSAQTFMYARVWSDPAALFSSAVRTQPQSSRAHRMLGGEFMEEGRPAEAAAEFRRALEILDDPSVPNSQRSRPRLELGVACEQIGRLGESEALYLAVISEDPKDADALWRLGVVRWRQGRVPEAEALWQEAITTDPHHARAMSDLGIAYLVAGNSAGAKDMWLRAASADPTLASVWYRLGDLYEQEGDVGRARAAWTEFLNRAHERYPDLRAAAARKLGLLSAPR